MEHDVPTNPVDVRLLCSPAVMTGLNRVSHPIEQLRWLLVHVGGYRELRANVENEESGRSESYTERRVAKTATAQ